MAIEGPYGDAGVAGWRRRPPPRASPSRRDGALPGHRHRVHRPGGPAGRRPLRRGVPHRPAGDDRARSSGRGQARVHAPVAGPVADAGHRLLPVRRSCCPSSRRNFVLFTDGRSGATSRSRGCANAGRHPPVRPRSAARHLLPGGVPASHGHGGPAREGRRPGRSSAGRDPRGAAPARAGELRWALPASGTCGNPPTAQPVPGHDGVPAQCGQARGPGGGAQEHLQPPPRRTASAPDAWDAAQFIDGSGG